MTIDTIEKEFKKTKFAKGGGVCFECCDYEGMYDDLLSFIRKLLSQAREEERQNIKLIAEEFCDTDFGTMDYEAFAKAVLDYLSTLASEEKKV